jgi:hypothetical protein
MEVGREERREERKRRVGAYLDSMSGIRQRS